MLKDWASHGLALSEFWGVTPREAQAIFEGVADRIWRDLRREQSFTYALAQLVGVAIGDPKKFPAFEKAFPDPRRPEQTPEDHLAILGQIAAANQAQER